MLFEALIQRENNHYKDYLNLPYELELFFFFSLHWVSFSDSKNLATTGFRNIATVF